MVAVGFPPGVIVGVGCPGANVGTGVETAGWAQPANRMMAINKKSECFTLVILMLTSLNRVLFHSTCIRRNCKKIDHKAVYHNF
jgi:hypothetical protein